MRIWAPKGADAGDSVPFQLEAVVGDCWNEPASLPVSFSRRRRQEGTDCGLSQGTEAASQAALADRTGWSQGAPSKLVRDYLSTEGHLQVAFLPPYAPDLKPVEYLWAWLKRHALANFCPDNLSELLFTARNRLKSVQRRPNIIAACWQQAELW